MQHTKFNWRLALLHLTGVYVLVVIITQGSTSYLISRHPDTILASGKWAVRFLLFCLAMSPLNTYFGWRWAIKLRKPAGLWAFGFAFLHAWTYLTELQQIMLRTFFGVDFIMLGVFGFLMLAALAATSNRAAMRWLGKNWKRLHRLVYLAGIVVLTHAILATEMSKRVWAKNPKAVPELLAYLAILTVLLLIRFPTIRRLLTSPFRPQQAKHIISTD